MPINGKSPYYFYCEAIISALIGGTLGCIAGWGLARFIGSALFGVPLSFAWIVIPCVLMLSILIAVVGTWFPAHRIANFTLWRFCMAANKSMFWRLIFQALRLRLQRVFIIFSALDCRCIYCDRNGRSVFRY